MKHIKLVAIGTLLLIGVSGASAQSLGDYARTARKNKVEPKSASRHFDNDNLPTDQKLSVVGPPAPSTAGQDAGFADPAQAKSMATSTTTAAAAADRQKAADEMKQTLDKQKEKVDALNHELDLDQREYRLKAASYYADAGARLRDAAQFDKDGADHKKDIEDKQKAIDAAKQQLDELQEQARKAGVAEKDKDKE
jgi:hypothetical protein